MGELMTHPADEVKLTTALAHAIAELATRAIGPNGTVTKVHAEDASLVRTMFIAQLAEAATKIANGETK